jgi:hypothetical protein
VVGEVERAGGRSRSATHAPRYFDKREEEGNKEAEDEELPFVMAVEVAIDGTLVGGGYKISNRSRLLPCRQSSYWRFTDIFEQSAPSRCNVALAVVMYLRKVTVEFKATKYREPALGVGKRARSDVALR